LLNQQGHHGRKLVFCGAKLCLQLLINEQHMNFDLVEFLNDLAVLSDIPPTVCLLIDRDDLFKEGCVELVDERLVDLIDVRLQQ
jgi:hypothetical protein